MALAEDLIQTSLRPATLRVGERVKAVLRIHNVGDRRCTNLVLEFELPQALAVDHGRRQIQPGLQLAAGDWHDHPLHVRARQPGRCAITIVNFSFQDGTGRTQRYDNRTIDIDVQPSAPRQQVPPPRPSPACPAQSIFISYRHIDTGWAADPLVKRLRRHFPPQQVFLDSSSISSGEDFRHRLNAELESCAVLLALIGSQWLTVTTSTGERRIDADGDIVRYEIAFALSRGILVIPVLVDTMTMPVAGELPADIRALADRIAQPLTRRYFKTDVKEIVSAIRRVLRPAAS